MTLTTLQEIAIWNILKSVNKGKDNGPKSR